MKRVLLICFLLTASYTPAFIHHAIAQAAMTPPTPTTITAFTTEINQLDSYIAAGDMTDAQSTWNLVHQMMLNVLAVSKYSIRSAATPADATDHKTILNNQVSIYKQVWSLKTDLAANRTALHTQLIAFGSTIY